MTWRGWVAWGPVADVGRIGRRSRQELGLEDPKMLADKMVPFRLGPAQARTWRGGRGKAVPGRVQCRWGSPEAE